MNFIRALLFLFILPTCGLKWGEDPPPASSFNQESVGGACADQDYKKAFASYFFEEGDSSHKGATSSLSFVLNCLADTITETKDFFYDESLNRAELIQLLRQDFVRTRATAPIVDHILAPDYNYLDHYIGIKTSWVEMMTAGEEGRFVAEDLMCGHLSSAEVFSKADADALVRFLRGLAVLAPRLQQEAEQLFSQLQDQPLALLLNEAPLRQKLLSGLAEIFKESQPGFARFLEEGFSPTAEDTNRELFFRSLFRMAGLFPGPSERLGVPQIKYILLNLYITAQLFPLYDKDGDFVISHQEAKPLSCLTSRLVSLVISPRLGELPYSVQAFLNPQAVSDYILDRQKLPLSEEGSLNWDYFPYYLSAHPKDPKNLSYAEMSSLVSTLFATGFFFHKKRQALQNKSASHAVSGLLSLAGLSQSGLGSSSAETLGPPAESSGPPSSGSASNEGPQPGSGPAVSPPAESPVELVLTAKTLRTLSSQAGFPLSQERAERILSLASPLLDTVKSLKAGQDLSSFCSADPSPESVRISSKTLFELGQDLAGFMATAQQSGEAFVESFFADPQAQAWLAPQPATARGDLLSRDGGFSQEALFHPDFNRLFVAKLADWFEERLPGWSRFLRGNLSAPIVAEPPHPFSEEKSAFFAEQVMADLWEIAGPARPSIELFRAHARFVFLHIYTNSFLFSLLDQDKDLMLSPQEQEPLSCFYARLFEAAVEPFLSPYNDLVKSFLSPKALADYFISRGESSFSSGKALAFNQEELARFARWRLLEGGEISEDLSYGGMSRHLLQGFSLVKNLIPGARQAFNDGGEISALSGLFNPHSDLSGLFNPQSADEASHTLAGPAGAAGGSDHFAKTSHGHRAFYPWLIRLLRAEPEQTLSSSGLDPGAESVATARHTGHSRAGASIGASNILTKQALEEFVEKSGRLLPQDTDAYLVILNDAMATAGLYQEAWSVPAESVCGAVAEEDTLATEPLPLDFEVFSARDSLTLNKMLASLGRILPEAQRDSQNLFIRLQGEWEAYDGLSKTELASGPLSTHFASVLISYFKDKFPEQARFWDEIFLQARFEGPSPGGVLPSAPTSLEYDFPSSRPPAEFEGLDSTGGAEGADFQELLSADSALEGAGSAERAGLAQEAGAPLEGLSPPLPSQKAGILWQLIHRPFKSQDHLSAQNIRSFVLNAYTAQALFDVLDYDGDLRLSLEELRPLACLSSRLLRVALRPLRQSYPLLQEFPLSQVVIAYLLEHKSLPPFIAIDGASLSFQWVKLPEGKDALSWFFRQSLESRSRIFDLPNLLPQTPLAGEEGPFYLSAGEFSLLTALMHSAGYDLLEAFLYGRQEEEEATAPTAPSWRDSFARFLQKSPLSLDDLRGWGNSAKTWLDAQVSGSATALEGVEGVAQSASECVGDCPVEIPRRERSADRYEEPLDNQPAKGDFPFDPFLYPQR